MLIQNIKKEFNVFTHTVEKTIDNLYSHFYSIWVYYDQKYKLKPLLQFLLLITFLTWLWYALHFDSRFEHIPTDEYSSVKRAFFELTSYIDQQDKVIEKQSKQLEIAVTKLDRTNQYLRTTAASITIVSTITFVLGFTSAVILIAIKSSR